MSASSMHAFTALASPWPALRLWLVDLDRDPSPGGFGRLSAPERERAARFAFERDRLRYLRAHAALHALLADALAPAGRAGAIAFDTGPWGKPAVRGAAGLHFNLSHSGALAVVGLSADAPVGVDVEVLRPMADAGLLAQAHFSAREQAALQATPAHGRDLAFLRCWTRKEAVAKALGTGLDLDLRTLEVGIGAAGGTTQVRAPLAQVCGADMQLASFELPQGAVVSVARTGGAARADRPVAEEMAA